MTGASPHPDPATITHPPASITIAMRTITNPIGLCSPGARSADGLCTEFLRMPDASENPQPATRTLRRTIRRVLAWACRLALCGVILAFALGRAFSDAHTWSQWLFWMPHEAWLFPIWLLAIAIVLLEPPDPRRAWARLGPLAAAVLALAYVSFAHWRLHNALLVRPGETAIRVYHWNATEATDESLQRFLRDADPFALANDSESVVVLANPPLRLDWPEIVRMLADEEISAADVTAHVRRGGRFVLISGMPMIDAGWTSLQLDAKTPEPDLTDNGAAMFASIEFAGAPVTVWAIDWPSEPGRSRRTFVRATLERIETSTRLIYEPTAAGPLQRREEQGFPRPDVVVGDFNTARGSAAIEALLPGMASAHAQAGIGPDYGWPRFIRDGRIDRAFVPFLGLDQAFVDSENWRVTAYRMLDMDEGTHRAQEVFVTRAGRPGRSAPSPADRAGAN